jgi:hypothetical protein
MHKQHVAAAHRASPMLPLPAAALDLVARQPVWEALSELYLDTDPALSRQWRAEQLAASPYTLEQLAFILKNEVHPVCKHNLWSVAGVWTGFDSEWLQAQILRHLSARRSVFRWPTLFRWLKPGRFAVTASPEWRATQFAVLAARGTRAEPVA